MWVHEAIFFGVHRALRTGTATAFRQMVEAERWTPDELARVRDGKMGRLWAHLRALAPFWRQRLPSGALLDERGRMRPDVWRQAPVLGREDVRAHFADLVAFPDEAARRAWLAEGRRALPRGWVLQKSGGSTGQPVEYLQDWAWRGWNRAAALWCDKMSGAWPCRQRRLKVWGGVSEISVAHASVTARLSNWLQQSEVLPSFRLDEAVMRAHLARIDRERDVATLEGYASTLFTVAQFAETAGIRVRPVQRVISSAGTLSPDMRAVMERVFGAPVFNRYGSRDGGATANQCELRRGLHLSELSLYVEVVDERGEPVPDGTPGEILLTQLENLGMPLVRYRIGDVGVIDPEPCACGRPHRALRELKGRSSERVRTADGRILDHTYFLHLIGVVLNDGWLDRFQVVQHALDDVEVLLAPRVSVPPDDVERGTAAVTREVGSALGPRVRLTVRRVDAIAPSASGKFLYVVSKV